MFSIIKIPVTMSHLMLIIPEMGRTPHAKTGNDRSGYRLNESQENGAGAEVMFKSGPAWL